MRIYKDRFYVLADHPGISGFKDYSRLDYRIVTGHKASRERCYVVGEFLPIAEDWYRLEDGHLPEHQPKATTREALEWLTANPYSAVVRLDPATRSKDIPPHYKAA